MNKPTTILHARVVSGSGGGPDKTILRSAAMLDATRYHAAAAYLHPAGDTSIDNLRGTAARYGMAMHTIPERGPVDIRAIRLLLDLCRRLRVEVWHAHDYKTDMLGCLLRRWHPMQLVTTMHGFTGETLRTRFYARLSHLALRRYDRVLAVSPLLLRYAAEHGVHPDRLHLITNAIDLNESARKQTREQAKHALGLSPDEHALCVVARFSKEKGVDRAIQLFAKIHKLRPQTRLHLIGDGPEQASLQRLATQLGVNEAIRWWGWRRETQHITEAMDTLLLTSHTEGLPNVVLEAMAIGLPVAATRVGAVPQVLDDGACGILLGDALDAWPTQVLPLIDQPLIRERLLCAAWVRVTEQYDFSKRMQRVAAIYDKLMGRDIPAPRRLPAAA